MLKTAGPGPLTVVPAIKQLLELRNERFIFFSAVRKNLELFKAHKCYIKILLENPLLGTCK